jgi:hypothetical protein
MIFAVMRRNQALYIETTGARKMTLPTMEPVLVGKAGTEGRQARSVPGL